MIVVYKAADFSDIIPMLADDVEYSSYWVLETMKGKARVTDYYIGKGKALRKSTTEINGEVVVITDSLSKNGNIGIYTEKGKVCALISQKVKR